MNILLGPYFFVRDPAPENFWTGIVLCAVLLPAMALGFVRPWRVWRMFVTAGAVVGWLAAGVIGRAISA